MLECGVYREGHYSNIFNFLQLGRKREREISKLERERKKERDKITNDV